MYFEIVNVLMHVKLALVNLIAGLSFFLPPLLLLLLVVLLEGEVPQGNLVQGIKMGYISTQVEFNHQITASNKMQGQI